MRRSRFEQERKRGRQRREDRAYDIEQQSADGFREGRPPARIDSRVAHVLPDLNHRGERQHLAGPNKEVHEIERRGVGDHSEGRRSQIAAQFPHSRNGVVKLVRLERRKSSAATRDWANSRIAASSPAKLAKMKSRGTNPSRQSCAERNRSEEGTSPSYGSDELLDRTLCVW